MYDVFLRFPDYKTKAVTFSYDDGVEQDEKLIHIFNQNGLKAAFNLNTGLIAPEGTQYPEGQLHRRLSMSGIRRVYKDGSHELALHSLHHKYMDHLQTGELICEIAEDKKNLEALTGKIIRGFACPYGRSSEALRSVLAQMDILYSRGVGTTMRFDLPQELLDITPTCRHSSEGLDGLIGQFLSDSPLDSYHDRHPWLFNMWGHAYEFERDHAWTLMETLAGMLGGHADIWYATNIEIFSYIADYRRLVYSADAGLVFNPTASMIWLESSWTLFTVAPGETKRVPRKPVREFVLEER